MSKASLETLIEARVELERTKLAKAYKERIESIEKGYEELEGRSDKRIAELEREIEALKEAQKDTTYTDETSWAPYFRPGATFNLTKQGELMKHNPALAKRLLRNKGRS